jgi:hypothetical protein
MSEEEKIKNFAMKLISRMERMYLPKTKKLHRLAWEVAFYGLMHARRIRRASFK